MISLPHLKNQEINKVSIACRGHSKKPLSRAKIFGFLVLVFSTFYQCIAFNDDVNLRCAVICFIGVSLIGSILLRRKVLTHYPLSSYVIIGFASLHLYLPIIFVSLESKPLTTNLKMPVEVFTHTLVNLITLLCFHGIYRHVTLFTKLRSQLSHGLLSKLGLFKPPTNIQFWLMGALGILALTYMSYGSIGSFGFTGKFIQSLTPYAFAPLVAIVRLWFDAEKREKNIGFSAFVPYIIILLALAITRNSRSAFMQGFANLGLGILYGILMSVIPSRWLRPRNVLLGAFAIFLIAGPISDLATAMVMVRSDRGEVSQEVLMQLTLAAFADKEAIKYYREKQLGKELFWNERYIDNLFLARFCNMKFADNSLVDASRLPDDSRKEAQSFEWRRVLSMLPQPVVDLIGIDAQKNLVNAMSWGDFLFYLSTKKVSVLGGFRTGHFFGSGMAVFGWAYPLVLGCLMLPCFFLLDSLSYIKTHCGHTMIILSPATLLSFYFFFVWLSSAAKGAEAISEVSGFLVRGWFQMVLIYALVFKCVRLVTSMYTNIKGLRYNSQARN